MHIRHPRALLGCIALALVGPAIAMAHEPAEQESIRPVMQQAIPELPGKLVRIVTVSYQPGQASDAHMHPGSVFAYVAQGSVSPNSKTSRPIPTDRARAGTKPPASIT